MSVSVRLSLGLSARAYLRNQTSKLYRVFVHVIHGRGSVLLCQRYDTLCTSGFMDDVKFSPAGGRVTVAASGVLASSCPG